MMILEVQRYVCAHQWNRAGNFRWCTRLNTEWARVDVWDRLPRNYGPLWQGQEHSWPRGCSRSPVAALQSTQEFCAVALRVDVTFVANNSLNHDQIRNTPLADGACSSDPHP